MNELLEEDRGILDQIGTLRERKCALADLTDENYERTFMRAASELLGEEMCRRIHARASQIAERRRERVAALGVGSALPMSGGASGPRRRKEDRA